MTKAKDLQSKLESTVSKLSELGVEFNGFVLGAAIGSGLVNAYPIISNAIEYNIKYEKLIAELKSMGFDPDYDNIIEAFNSTRLELLDQVSFEIKKKYLSRNK